jgi:hypothetical protein
MKYLIALLFFIPGFAAACSFTADADIFKPMGDIVDKYDYAFVAYLGERQNTGQYEANYDLDISQNYKGSLDTDAAYNLYSGNHSCAYFGKGDRWGVFLMNEIDEIAEYTPKRFFDTEAEAQVYADQQFDTKVGGVDLGKEIPQGCVLWNDGCNECSVVDGKLNACTERACLTLNEPYCVAYADGQGDENTQSQSPEQQPTVVQGPTENPEQNFIEPTTPPPYDNSPQDPEDKKSLWQSILDFFTNLIPWSW